MTSDGRLAGILRGRHGELGVTGLGGDRLGTAVMLSHVLLDGASDPAQARLRPGIAASGPPL